MPGYRPGMPRLEQPPRRSIRTAIARGFLTPALPRRVAGPIVGLAGALAVLSGGCSAVGLGRSVGGQSSITGQDGRVALAADFRTFAYVPGPNATADVYMTDFSPEELDAFFDESGAWTGLEGHILHVHMFLTPRAGSTPIDPTAANAAARLLVLSGGQIGVYTGAGFLLPDRAPGGRSFGGSVLDASLRLDHASDYFIDRLGPTRLELSFRAPRDEPLAGALAARLNAAQRTAQPVARAGIDAAPRADAPSDGAP